MYTDKISLSRIKTLYWDREYNVKEIAEKLGISMWSLYNLMNKNNIPRRLPSEYNYITNKDKPKFEIKGDLNLGEQQLKIAGIMLYWAEGTLKGQTVDFSNSNPEMVKIFLKFLREICGVSEKRLRLYLYAYSYQDLKTIKEYWHKVTNIPLNQFTKPYVRKGNLNISKRKLPYGLVHVRYNDKKLLTAIESWIRDHTNRVLLWVGTQAAKGDRLSKGSVLSKGRMEK